MRLIKNDQQLMSNIETVEKYLTEGNEAERSFIRDLIRKGKCFVAYKIGKEIRMAPSRFLGYIENDITKHAKARETNDVDGRDTNPAINKVLESKLLPSAEMEKAYLQYCNSLGIIPFDYKKRRYWILNLDKDFIANTESGGEFPEGMIVERIHKSRERSSRVIEIAKENFKRKHGKLICQACGFNFENKYGSIGKDFIEGHHIIPVSEMEEGHKTKPEEIALLCSNCHRMIHKRRPWLTLKNLHVLIKAKK